MYLQHDEALLRLNMGLPKLGLEDCCEQADLSSGCALEVTL